MNQVPETILKQLGGGRFLAMTGAFNLVGSDDALTMRLPGKTRMKGNWVRITLDPSDTYVMEYQRLVTKDFVPTLNMIERRSYVYADELQAHFKDMTGLDTHL